MDHQSITQFFLLYKLPLCLIRIAKTGGSHHCINIPILLLPPYQKRQDIITLYIAFMCARTSMQKINFVIMKFVCFTISL